jgi:hypothetical protein
VQTISMPSKALIMLYLSPRFLVHVRQGIKSHFIGSEGHLRLYGVTLYPKKQRLHSSCLPDSHESTIALG